MRYLRFVALVILTTAVQVHAGVSAVDPAPHTPGTTDAGTIDHAAAAHGLESLINHAFLPSDFDQEVFDNLWRSWPKKLHDRASDASLGERRAMAFARYGLTPRSSHDASLTASEDSDLADPGKPLQYVVDENRDWTMNCFSCHGGTVYGQPIPGAPNNRYALQTLTEEVRRTKFRLGKPLGRMELGSLVIPLGTTNGTTNAVVFGMGLMNYRDDQLNLVDRPPVAFTHHDMDAPPWWHFYRRPYIYIDGFAPKGHRGLMQFMLVPENKASFFVDHENEFRDVYAYLSSLRAPKYLGSVDPLLAARGAKLFKSNCAECHGTYDYITDAESIAAYPNQMVPIEEIGTDPVRHSALNVAGREHYSRSWFARAGETNQRKTITNPAGYVAPPLDGVWASAPYFHNGSVPTLWHVLHPTLRPTVWRRVNDAMDESKVGLSIETVDRVPFEEPDVAIRRSYFDTRRFGKSASGHDYPDQLDESEKRAVLEYLKTL